MTRFLHIVILFFVPVLMVAQPDLEMTKKAAAQFSKGELDNALNTIELAIQSGEDDAYTWHVKGFIHKEIFKDIDSLNSGSEHRVLAIESLTRSKSIDNENDYKANNDRALIFLGKTYYTDAMNLAEGFFPEAEQQILASFERYVEIVSPIEGGTETAMVDFYKTMGRAYEKWFYKYPGKKDYIDRAISYYEKALAINRKDYEANYNTAVSYYNQGVFAIKKVNHKTEVSELFEIQGECIMLFKKALPFMLEAYGQTPERKETLKGLMAIYRALNEYDKSQEYQATYDRLVDEGKIRE